jgi:hypothetical protein
MSNYSWKLIVEDKVALTTLDGWTTKELYYKPNGTWDASVVDPIAITDLLVGKSFEPLILEPIYIALL